MTSPPTMAMDFPRSVIIIGAGVFGLSSALCIARRYPNTKVTVIDRHTPPVEDGTSVDTSRILRPDYLDKAYEALAEKAQSLIKNDPELAPHYFENGFTFCIDDEPGDLKTLWQGMLENIRKTQLESKYNELNSPTEIYHHLHDTTTKPKSQGHAVEKWRRGYTNKRCATVNAETMVKVYYDRCCAMSNITFEVGVPVDRLLYDNEHTTAEGVVLEDNRVFRAAIVIVAAGPWSSRFVKLDNQMHANAVPIAYIQLTPSEYKKYSHIACHTNLSTGLNIFTPIGGQLKVLRRTTALRNTTTLKDPENPAKIYQASYPLTKLDDPHQTLPLEIEQSIRSELKEIFPHVADRPFSKTKFCWQEQTTNGDFLICPHPRFQNLHLATGGSLHSWKFLPLLGEFVVDSINGRLSSELAEKWSWESKSKAKANTLCFMEDVAPREFQNVLRSSKGCSPSVGGMKRVGAQETNLTTGWCTED